MKQAKDKKQIRSARKGRIRAKISGTSETPRLCVFKSNKYIYAQLIDDSAAKTLASASSCNVQDKSKKTSEVAEIVGDKIAQSAKSQNIKSAVFDRGGFLYTGNIKKLADGARKGGLNF